MTDLDVLAREFIERLDTPAGPGVRVVMQRGRRRRNRRRALTGLAGVTASAAVVVGLGIIATQTGGSDDVMLVITESADGPGSTDDAADLDVDVAVTIDTDGLPARDPALVPTVPTPVLDGWTVEVIAVDLTDRSSDAGHTVRYRFRASGSELTMTVATGQVPLGSDLVTIDRPTGLVDGSIESAGGGLRVLSWNERPGVNNGAAVWLRGPAEDQLLEIARTVEFLDRPLTGAAAPSFVDLDPDRSTLFAGTVDGQVWSVTQQSERGETLIEIGGQSPTISGELVRPSSTGAGIETTTVSRDGLQITTVLAPADTRSIEIGLADGTRIPLPFRTIDATDRTIAVSAVPADREPGVIIVSQNDGTETDVGLPIAPLGGWTTSRLSLEPY